MTAQHTRTFAAEPLQEQIIPLSEEFIQSLTVQGTLPNGQKVQAPEPVADFVRAQFQAILAHHDVSVQRGSRNPGTVPPHSCQVGR